MVYVELCAERKGRKRVFVALIAAMNPPYCYTIGLLLLLLLLVVLLATAVDAASFHRRDAYDADKGNGHGQAAFDWVGSETARRSEEEAPRWWEQDVEYDGGADNGVYYYGAGDGHDGHDARRQHRNSCEKVVGFFCVCVVMGTSAIPRRTYSATFGVIKRLYPFSHRTNGGRGGGMLSGEGGGDRQV